MVCICRLMWHHTLRRTPTIIKESCALVYYFLRRQPLAMVSLKSSLRKKTQICAVKPAPVPREDKQWQPSKYTHICGEHFITGQLNNLTRIVVIEWGNQHRHKHEERHIRCIIVATNIYFMAYCEIFLKPTKNFFLAFLEFCCHNFFK